ncbi:MAG: H-type lectin domain-containing protein [Ignavibacteriaceae bacterium]|nr:H-type lectin domain-containing protein [Ignavibacteriaceae bacterium]
MKNIIAIVSFFLLIQTSADAQHHVYDKFSYDYTLSGYNLDKYSGERVFTQSIKFKNKLDYIPEIIFNVNSIDASSQDNLRYRIEATMVTSEGFLLRIKTWGNSKIFSIAGHWQAVKSNE